jgi:peptidoglycan LD-endopeptidase CwlK
MNAHSEALLSKVNPVLAARIQAVASSLAAQGITIIVVQGLRTVEEQDALYAQGRTSPGKIVTNAKGGQSWHNFGLAVDCAPENPDNSIDWNASHPQWKAMEAAGVKMGLVSGANWVRIADAPHFQMTGRFPEAAPDTETRELFKTGGLEAIWNEIVPLVDTPEVENA